eukprot:Lankesteria_metandrocarpae@DN4976_c0_g1_i3.p1
MDESKVVDASSVESSTTSQSGGVVKSDLKDLPVKKDANAFSSRWAFWLSAIGCSVGFGNLWRFPYLCYENGGAAFLVPYAFMLLFVATPVSMLEFGVGQLSQGGQGKGFRAIHERSGGLAWSFLVGFGVLSYYPILLAWSLMYCANSFRKDLPWTVTTEDTNQCQAATVEEACQVASNACSYNTETGKCTAEILNKAIYFFEVNLSADPDYTKGIYEFNGYIFLCDTVTFIVAFLAIVGGARFIGYVNYVITTLPALLLLFLVGVGASLDGAIDGINLYIGKWQSSYIIKASTWSAAASQTLFSLGASQGAMAGYASHNRRDQNFVQDTVVVVLGDTLFAFVAGFAVFGVIGFMSFTTGTPVDELPISGGGLAFLTYPVGISEAFGYPFAQMFLVLFFFMLWLLGLSTILGAVEGMVVVVSECRTWNRFAARGFLKRWHIYAAFMVALYLFCFLSSTNYGVHNLDAVDHYLSTFGFIFAAGMESIAGGWLAGSDLWIEKCGAAAVYTHFGTYILSICIGPILFATVSDTNNTNVIVGMVTGGCIFFGGVIAAFFLGHKEGADGSDYTLGERLYNILFYNNFLLRDYMNNIACRNTVWRVSRLWCVTIKYVTPLLLSMLFWSTVCTPDLMYHWPNPDVPYPVWLYVYASIIPYAVFFGLLFFFFFPQFSKFLLPEEEFVFELGVGMKASILSEPGTTADYSDVALGAAHAELSLSSVSVVVH